MPDYNTSTKRKTVATGDKFLDLLWNGGTEIPNPNYNPKSKIESERERFIKDRSLSNEENDTAHKVADKSSRYQYDYAGLARRRGLDKEGLEKDRKKGINPLNPYNSDAQYNKAKAKAQSTIDKIANFLVRTGVGEIALGTLEGVFDIWDGMVNSFTGDTYNRNPATSFFKGLRDQLDENFKIYQENPDKSWQMRDLGWWLENGISIFSTASLLLPAVGWSAALRGFSKLTRLPKLARWTSRAIASRAYSQEVTGLNKFSTLRNVARKANKIERQGELWGESLATAYFSRTGENMQEARQVYDDIFENSKENLENMPDEEFAKFLDMNPEFQNMNKEDIAKAIARKGANKTFANDYYMLFNDLLQFRALGSIFKAASGGTPNAATRIAAKNYLKRLENVSKGVDPNKGLTRINMFTRARENLKYMRKQPLKSVTLLELHEGFEEFFQGVQQDKGMEIAAKYFDPTIKSRTISSYLSDSSLWEQGFWGAIGGLMFGEFHGGVRAIAKKANAKYQQKKHNLSAEDYERLKMSDNKILQERFNGMYERTERFIDDITAISEGRNPFNFKLDEQGNRIKLDTTGPIEGDAPVTDDLKALYMQQALEEFVRDETFEAVDNGTYQMMKELLSSSQFKDYLKHKGAKLTKEDEELSTQVVDRMGEIADTYISILDSFANFGEANPFVVKAAARSVARNVLALRDSEQQIEINNAKIDELLRNSGKRLSDSWESHTTLDILIRTIRNLRSTKEDYEKLLQDGKMTKGAYQRQMHDINKAISSLQNTLIRNLNLYSDEYSDEVKEALNNLGNAEDLDKAFKNLSDAWNNYLSSENPFAKLRERNETPTDDIKKLVNQNAQLKADNAIREAITPETDEEYKDLYDDFAQAMDLNVMNRLDHYAQIIRDYLYNSENFDDALAALYDKEKYDTLPKKVQEALEGLLPGYYGNQLTVNTGNARFKLAVETARSKREEKDNRNKKMEDQAKEDQNEEEKKKKEEEEKKKKKDKQEVPPSGENLDKTDKTDKTDKDKNKDNVDKTDEKSEKEKKDKEKKNARINELLKKQEDGTLTDEEAAELERSITSQEGLTEYFQRVFEEDTATDVLVEELFNYYYMLFIKSGKNLATFIKILNKYASAKIKELGERKQGNVPLYSNSQIEATNQQVLFSILPRIISMNIESSKQDEFINLYQNALLSIGKTTSDDLKLNDISDTSDKNVEANRNSISDFINGAGEEYEKALKESIEAFLEYYFKEIKGIATENGKKIINIENLFNFIINDKHIRTGSARTLYVKLAEYVRLFGTNSDYFFTGRPLGRNMMSSREFMKQLTDSNERAKVATKVSDMHVYTVAEDKSNVDDDYRNAIIAIKDKKARTFVIKDLQKGSLNIMCQFRDEKTGKTKEVKVGILRNVISTKDGKIIPKSHFTGFRNKFISETELDCDFLFEALIAVANNDSTKTEKGRELFNMLLQYNMNYMIAYEECNRIYGNKNETDKVRKVNKIIHQMPIRHKIQQITEEVEKDFKSKPKTERDKIINERIENELQSTITNFFKNDLIRDLLYKKVGSESGTEKTESIFKFHYNRHEETDKIKNIIEDFIKNPDKKIDFEKLTPREKENVLRGLEWRYRDVSTSISNIIFYKDGVDDLDPQKNAMMGKFENNYSNDMICDGKSMRISYNNWKTRLASNYESTAKLNDLIKDNQEFDIKVNLRVNNVLPIDKKEDGTYNWKRLHDGDEGININLNQGEPGYTPFVIVDSSHTLIVDGKKTNIRVPEEKVGSAGFLAGYTKDNKPLIAYTKMVTFNSKKNKTDAKYINAIKSELFNIFSIYFDKTLDDNGENYRSEQIHRRLLDLFQSGGLFTFANGDFNGITISKSNNGSIVVYKGVSSSRKQRLLMSFNFAGNDESGNPIENSITIYNPNNKNGAIELTKDIFKTDENKITDKTTNSIVQNNLDTLLTGIRFNLSYDLTERKNYRYYSADEGGVIDKADTNCYYGFDDAGRFHVNIGKDKDCVFNIYEKGYGEFVWKSGGFLTTVMSSSEYKKNKLGNSKMVITSNGILCQTIDAINITIDYNNTNSPEINVPEKENTVFDLVFTKEGNLKRKTIDTADLLEAAGVEEEVIKILMDKDAPLLMKRVYPDLPEHRLDAAKTPKDEAFLFYQKKGKESRIFITPKGALALSNRKINDINTVDESIRTVNTRNNAIRLLVHENLHRHIALLDDKTREHLFAELKSIHSFVMNEIEGLVDDNSNKVKNRILNVVNSYENEEEMLEEFFVESLTNKELTFWLNEHKWKESVDLTNAKNANKKTIFQKILDALLSIFNYFGFNNIKDDSILAKEYILISGLKKNQVSKNIPTTNTAELEKAKNTVDTIKQRFGEKVKYPNGKNESHVYLGANDEKIDTSVTTVLNEESGEFDEQWGTVSTSLGNTVDAATRSFFQNGTSLDEEKIPNVKDTSSMETVTPEESRNSKQSFIGELQKLKGVLDKKFGEKGWIAISEEFPIIGTIVDKKGNRRTIAGTIDLIICDSQGNIHLFDFKTKRGNASTTFNEKQLDKYRRQLHAYREIIVQEFPELADKIKVDSLIKFDVGYPSPSDTLIYQSDDDNQIEVIENGESSLIQDRSDYHAPSFDEKTGLVDVSEAPEGKILVTKNKDGKIVNEYTIEKYENPENPPSNDNEEDNQFTEEDFEALSEDELDDVVEYFAKTEFIEIEPSSTNVTTNISTFANKTNLEVTSEIMNATNKEISPTGGIAIDDMDSFVESFPDEFRKNVKEFVESGELQYVCSI